MPVISGSGGGAFNGGTITKPLVIDVSGDATGNSLPLQLRGSWNQQGVDFFSVFNTDTSVDAVAIDSGTNLRVNNHTTGAPVGSIGGTGLIHANAGYETAVITSGALPTVSPVSATAFQNITRDVHLVVPVTYNPTAGAAATCKVELSPDNVTFSTVGIETEPAGVALDGTIHLLTVFVPSTWYVKLTVTNAVLGTGTYY